MIVTILRVQFVGFLAFLFGPFFSGTGLFVKRQRNRIHVTSHSERGSELSTHCCPERGLRSLDQPR